MTQVNFLEQEVPSRWAVFHDESVCEQEHFLYHGFLFVRRTDGRRILNELLEPGGEVPNARSKRIHFADIRQLKGVRANAAVRWVELARDSWLPSGALRFYCLGVNLGNINYGLYRDSGLWAPQLPRKKDRVYRRFYEIGLKAALAWFQIEEADVTHVYYDQGKQDVDRFNKSLTICGPGTVIKPLANDCAVSGTDLSKYLQLADVLLGTVRKTFAGVAVSATAQAACVDRFYEIVERFSDSRRSYNSNSRYWKRFCLSFFPRRADMTAEEFFARDLQYHRKASGLFYCDRLTCQEKEAGKEQLGLFGN